MTNELCPQTAKYPLRGLLWAQFIEAFSDNAWKLIIFTLATRSIMDGPELNRASQVTATLSLLAFIIPMLTFSLPSSVLADRFSKRSIIISMKIVGVILMASAALSLFFMPHGLLAPYLILICMGIQGAIFSPAKYGILPELVPKEKLSKGNGLLEMGTMLAIIFGTGLGPVLLAADAGGTKPYLTCIGPIILTILASIALLWALTIPKVPPARQTAATPTETIKQAWNALRKDHILWLAILGSLGYWLILSLIGQNVLVFAKTLVIALEKGEVWQGIPTASFGFGIAAGALLAGKISGNRIEYGLIPLGTLGFAISSFSLGLIDKNMEMSIIILVIMGISTGLLVVPLHAIIQWRAPADKRGAIIALGNIFDITGMMLGSLLSTVMALAGLELNSILMLSSCIVLLTTLWALYVLPHSLPQFGFLCYSKLFYDIHVQGQKNLTTNGPLLVLSEHLSVSAILALCVAVERRIRLVMPAHHYNQWWIKPFAKMFGCIAIDKDISSETILKHYHKTSGCPKEQVFLCLLPKEDEGTGLTKIFIDGLKPIQQQPEAVTISLHMDRQMPPLHTLIASRFKKNGRVKCSARVLFGDPIPSMPPVASIRDLVS